MSDRTHYQHQQATNTSNNEESRQNHTYNKNNNTTTKYLQKNIPYPINSPVTTSQRTFGEPMQPLEEGVIRIASLNVNSLGKYSRSNPKQDLLKEWIHENDISVLGIQEVGVAMHMVSHYDKLEERMQDLRWTKLKVSYSSNRHERISVSQYGGTAICAFNEIAARANPRTGNDETGLGRWSWMLFEGRHQHKTRIISAYNPCRSTGNETVYMQHSRFFNNHGNAKCPRQMFMEDLTRQINKWQARGELIVLLIDCNENLARRGPLQTALLQKCRLLDPIRYAYQNDDSALPATSSNGSFPIDSIFVSRQIRHISRGGWLKHGTTIGDHRPLYIDIPIMTLLGEPTFHLDRPDARRLQCDNPKIVRKFNEILSLQLQKERTHLKYSELEAFIISNPNEKIEIASRLDKLDKSCTNSILRAERRCRKLSMGQVPWTPELSLAGNTINLWNLVIRKKYGRNVSSKHIKRLAKKCSIVAPMQLSLSDCEKERKIASQRYKELKKKAPAKRKKFIIQLAEEQSKAGNEKVSTAIRRIIHLEHDRKSRRRIKNATKPYHGATEKVLIRDPNNSTDEIITTDKEDIERALMQENKDKFLLAYSSPFLQPPYDDLIGQTATSKPAKKILKGTFRPPNNSSKTHSQFLKHLCMPASIKQKGCNKVEISVEEAAQYWSKKREKTSSSMSNRHIGTYKAMVKELPSLRLITNISSIAYSFGVTLPRWCIDLDVSLIKKPGRLRPSELRTIGMLEADFNHAATLHFSKRMMSTAIEHKLIPQSQFAKKGSRSIEAAVIKVLFFDYLRINKRNGAFLAMDLMQCFDRMAHPISSLATQRLGVHPNIAHTMITTLCNMRHFVRTAYGESEDYYIGTAQRPLQGGVQGNGAAAPIFIAISCILLNYFEHRVNGHNVRSAISLSLLMIAAIMYVDDTDILLSSHHYDEPIPILINRARHASTQWRKAVQQTGGALRPDKCRWYLISFKWKAGKWKYSKIADHPAEIYQKDTNGNQILVQRLESSFGHKGLGVCTAPDGSFIQQIDVLLQKIDKWNENIRTSYLTKYDVYTSAFSSIFKSVEYVLPATSFNSSQCIRLDRAIHKSYVSRIGINQHLPLAFRYAPKRFQGLNSLHISTQQFIEKIKIFLYHVHQNTPLGKSINIILESMQLLLCLDTPIFSLPFATYGFLCKKEQSWISNLWESAWNLELRIVGRHPCPTLARSNDFNLMERIIESERLSKKEILSIQRCLIYLQVLHASDISNGLGTAVRPSFIHRARPAYMSSKYKWPYQPKPPPSDWDAYDKALSEIWTEDGQYTFHTSLGEWTASSHIQSRWKYYPAIDSLCDHSSLPPSWYTRQRTSTRSNNRFEPLIRPPDANESPGYDALISSHNTSNPLLDGVIPLPKLPPDNDTQLRKLFQYSTFPAQGYTAASYIRNKQAIIVCDSSVMPSTNTAAASWILTSLNMNDDTCTGDHGVPHNNRPMDSYRGELYGLYCSLMVIKILCEKFAIFDGEVRVACDNDSALLNALCYDSRAKISCSNFDILWAIYDIRRQLKVKISPTQVLGHSDTKVKRPLTRVEWLNVIADRRASNFRSFIESNSRYEYSQLHMQRQYHLAYKDGTPITSMLSLAIKNHVEGEKLRKFLHSNGSLDYDAFPLIHWDAIEKATSSLTSQRYVWMIKFVSGFCGVATKMKSWGYWKSSSYPICSLCPENTSHLLRCNDDRVRKKYNRCLEKLLRWLRNNHTAPDIVDIIKLTLSQNDPSTTFSSHISTQQVGSMLHNAASHQDRIGVHNFFCGRIASTWCKLQQSYLLSIDSLRSAPLWASNVVLQLLQFSHSMWKHRCSIVHTSQAELLQAQEILELNNQIRDEYEIGVHGIRSCHRELFDEKCRDMLKKSTKDKKFWLLTIQASRQYVRVKESNMYSGMRDVMRSWQSQPD